MGQITTDFVEGLESLDDDSATLITSDNAIGWYDEEGGITDKDRHLIFSVDPDGLKVNDYTRKAVKLAYSKLKKRRETNDSNP